MTHIQQITANLGKTVQITGKSQYEGFGFNLAGKLETSEDDSYYVRVGEDYFAGPMGVSFRLSDILETQIKYHGDLQIILNK